MQIIKTIKLTLIFTALLMLGGCKSSSNTAPVANSQSITLNEDSTALIVLKGFDVDEYDDIDYIITQKPKHGKIEGRPPSLLYTPDGNYSGDDSLSFKVTDGKAESPEATVSIHIKPVNDIPVAFGQSITMDENKHVSIKLEGTDLESENNLSYKITQQTKHGKLTGTAPSLIYTPDLNFFGFDTFRFTVNDGEDDSPAQTVRINIVERPFRIRINTALPGGSTNNKQFAIPIHGGGYNYSIDCNDDGSFESINETNESIYFCDYNEPGEYTIAIRGIFPQIYENNSTLSDRVKIISIEEWGTQRWRSFERAFMGCANLTAITAQDNPILSSVTDMSRMFQNTPNLSEQDFSDWNVSNVTKHDDFCTGWGVANTPPDGWACPQ